MAAFAKRIQTELNNLQKPENKIENIDIIPAPNNPRLFDIYIRGPENTPFAGGKFHLQLFLPEGYPIKAPLVYFVTKIYHPNVDQLGRICLDTLADKWSPALQIPKVCLSILCLLSNANPDDPLDNNIAEVWKTNPQRAHAIARVMKSIFFILMAIVAIFAVSAVSIQSEEAAFPPVIFTYNATRCHSCQKRCFVKFDRSHMAGRQQCIAKCKSREICTEYTPVNYKPEPIKKRRLTLLQRANFTGRLPPVAKKEYVGAEIRHDSPSEFFKKLGEYINWRETQRLEQEKPTFADPEFKQELQIEAIPAICLSCIRAAPVDTVTPSFVEPAVKRIRPSKPAKPTTPVVPSTPVDRDEGPVDGGIVIMP